MTALRKFPIPTDSSDMRSIQIEATKMVVVTGENDVSSRTKSDTKDLKSEILIWETRIVQVHRKSLIMARRKFDARRIGGKIGRRQRQMMCNKVLNLEKKRGERTYLALKHPILRFWTRESSPFGKKRGEVERSRGGFLWGVETRPTR